MRRDITLICLAILVVSASAFAGSAAALYALRQENAHEMAALRASVEPKVCQLFANTNGTGNR